MSLPESSIIPVSETNGMSPLEIAIQRIGEFYRNTLPDEIVNYWQERAHTWESQNRPLSLDEWMQRISFVPDEKFDRSKINHLKPNGSEKTHQEIEQEASANYLKRIEPWVLGDLEISTDLITTLKSSEIINDVKFTEKEIDSTNVPGIIETINQIGRGKNIEERAMQIAHLFVDTQPKTPQSQEKISEALKPIMGATARKNYAKRLRHLENKIEKAKLLNQPDVIEEASKNLQAWKSSTRQESFLVNSMRAQKRLYQKLLNQPNLSPLIAKIEHMKATSTTRLYQRFPEVKQVIERADKTFMRIDVDQVTVGSFSWMQPTLEEDPSPNVHADKGVTLILMRVNPQTLEPEYYLCFTKRDSLDANESLTASHQTSWGRVQNPELNPIWNDLKDAMNGTSSTLFSSSTGIIYDSANKPLAVIAHQSPNGNRFKNSKTAHIVLNLDALSPEKQKNIPAALTSKVKLQDGTEIPTHFWLTQEQINAVASLGLPDIHDPNTINPAINSFTRSTSLGAQIMVPQIRAKLIEQHMANSGFTSELIQQFFDGQLFLENPTPEQTETLNWLTSTLLRVAIDGQMEKYRIDHSSSSAQLR